MDYKQLCSFIFELGHANNISNEGWKLIGIKQPSTLSQHLFRSAIIAFVIAKLEKHNNPYKLSFAVLTCKLTKLRLGDRDKVSSNYYDISEKVQNKVRDDQFALLGEDFKSEFFIHDKLSEDEKIIVHDAIQLQMAFEAKELISIGYLKAQIWIDRISKVVRTSSAKSILKSMNETSPSWWENLKKPPRTSKTEYVKGI